MPELGFAHSRLALEDGARWAASDGVEKPAEVGKLLVSPDNPPVHDPSAVFYTLRTIARMQTQPSGRTFDPVAVVLGYRVRPFNSAREHPTD